jgi:site-specific DNA recombinase
MADQIGLLKNIKKVAGLLRISTEKTNHEGKKTNLEETLKNHEVQMKTFFAEWGIELVLYKEVLSGGTAFEDRKALQEALKDLEDPDKNFDALAVIELERLSRDTYVSGIIKKTLENSGALLISLSPFQILDMNDNGDALMFGFASLIAEHNRKIASNRVKLNKIAMARQGQNSSGSVPFGYKRNPETKRLEIEKVQEGIDELGKPIMVEAPSVKIVRQIFKWYLEGIGQRTICDRLNEMGIKNKQGNKWIPNSLRVLLTTETYKGTLIARNFVKRKGKMVENEADTVIVENNHEAIIEPELFNKAQQFRDTKKERSGIDKRSRDWNEKKHFNILDGLIFCECCGRKSTIKWYNNRNLFHIIKCTRFDASGKTCENGGMGLRDIEKIVFEQLLKQKEEYEEKSRRFKINDFALQNDELEQKKDMLEKELERLQREFKAIRRLEKKYEMEKEETGVTDTDEEAEIEEDKKENKQQRLNITTKLEEVIEKLNNTPSAEQEIKRLDEKLKIIEELTSNKDLTNQEINAGLKKLILKIEYKRILPDDYKTMTKAEKDKHKAQIIIDPIE